MTHSTELNSEHPYTGPIVPIFVNGTRHDIHRGNTSVEEIKRVAGIPLQGYQLTQIIQLDDGTTKQSPLSDNGNVTIKGGETFRATERAAEFS